MQTLGSAPWSLVSSWKRKGDLVKGVAPFEYKAAYACRTPYKKDMISQRRVFVPIERVTTLDVSFLRVFAVLGRGPRGGALTFNDSKAMRIFWSERELRPFG